MTDFLLLSHDGAGLPLASKLSDEGAEVKVFIETPKARKQYRGILDHVSDWKPVLEDDPVIVFDSVGFGLSDEERPETDEDWEAYRSVGDDLIAQGHAVIGGSSVADRMELDRTWGASLAKKSGLLVPKATKFDDFDEARDFVEQTKLRYILKPHGNQATHLLYPADSWQDLVNMLDHFQEQFPEGAFELQEFVEGMQMSIEGWWNGAEFVSPNSTFEHKPQLSGDLGPFTGETGSLIYFYPDGQTTKMQTDVLSKMAPVLEDLHYSPGPLDCNCIINEDGAHFLEFTARFGYPALYAQMFATTDRWSDALTALADGTFGGFHPKPDKWFLISRVWIPKWPFGEVESVWIDAPLLSRIRPHHEPHLSLVDVWHNGQLRAAGVDGELLAITVGGDSIREAQGKLYQILHELYLYPMGWRSDLGVTVLDNLPSLGRWDYWMPAER